MNFEGACALALILWIAIRALPGREGSPVESQPTPPFNGRDALICLSICVAVAAVFWPARHIGFLSDDFKLVSYAKDYDIRWSFKSAGGDGFFRPLGYAFLWARWRWAGIDPLPWHLQALALHAVNAVLLYLLVRSLAYSRFAAGFAAALFAVHGTRPEAVAWTAASFDLLATMFVLAALLFFVRGYWILALIAMIAGSLSKESAYALPMMIVALGLWKGDLRKNVARKNLGRYCWFLAVAAALFAYRWDVVGGIGGYRNTAGQPEVASIGALGILKALGLRLWGVLFVPVNWAVPAGVVLEILLAITGAAIIWVAVSRANRRSFLLPLAWTLLAAIPTTHLLLIGPDLEKSRYLYLPSAAFALLLAVVIVASKQKWMVAAAVLGFHVAALEHNLGAWENASAKAESACAAVAASAQSPDGRILVLGLPQTLHGVYFFGNGFPECVAMRTANHAKIELQGGNRPTSRVDAESTFRWDPVTEELRAP